MTRPMRLAPLLLAAALAHTAESAAATADTIVPLDETFTMILQERERTFTMRNGTSWLLLEAADLETPRFLDRKDVMVQAKFESTDGRRAWFFGMESLAATAADGVWATRAEGDNLAVFGRIGIDAEGRIELTVADVVAGPSDADRIHARLTAVPTDDTAGRLAIAHWVRSEAEQQGNREFWLMAADNIVREVIDIATESNDAALLHQAVELAISELKDPTLAARVASSASLREDDGDHAKSIDSRMRALGYVWYRDAWNTKSDALLREFQDRFDGLSWRDADGFYRLGRWVEANADLVPRARELSHRCYQAGYRADADHNGIRRELGLTPADAKRNAARSSAPEGPYQHLETGIIAEGPEGWTRAQPIDGEATWIDPNSDTAFVSISVLPGMTTLAKAWEQQLAPLVERPGFQKLKEEPVAHAGGDARCLSYSFQEGRYTRYAEILVATGSPSAAVAISASYADGEQQRAHLALTSALARLVVPAAPPTAPAGK